MFSRVTEGFAAVATAGRIANESSATRSERERERDTAASS